MKHKAMKSFEKLSTQLVNLAMELSDEKDGETGAAQTALRLLRQELIVMLAGITRSLSRIFKL